MGSAGERDLRWPFVLAAATVLAVTTVGGLLSGAGRAPALEAALDTALLSAYLEVAALSLGVAASLLALHRWWVASEQVALAIGMALLLFTLVPLATGDLAQPLPWDPDALPWHGLTWADQVLSGVRPASLVVILALGARPLAGDRVSPPADLPILAGATVLVTAAMAVIFGEATAWGNVVDGGVVPADAAALPPLDVPAFALLGVLLVRAGHLRRRHLWSWAGLWSLTLAASEALRVLNPAPDMLGGVADELLVFLAAVFAACGAGRQLLATNAEQSRSAAGLAVTARRAEQWRRDEQRRAEELAHEARSALAAIEGATRTLQHYHDQLPPEAQRSLADAVSAEVHRLQELVTPQPAQASAVETLPLVELLAPLLAAEQARGTRVTVQVPSHLQVRATRYAVTQIVQTLLDNARVHAPASAVTLTAQEEDGWVLLRLADRGPGVPAAEHQAIFRRGVRGTNAGDDSGSGLGLYLAARLAAETGGRLWVEDRPGGGAAFVLALADAAVPEVPGGEPLAGVHDLEARRRARRAPEPDRTTEVG